MKYTLEDYETIQQLAKIINPNNQQINQIYELYKLYINPNARYPVLSNCGCGFGISDYWRAIINHANNNKDKFKNEVIEEVVNVVAKKSNKKNNIK